MGQSPAPQATEVGARPQTVRAIEVGALGAERPTDRLFEHGRVAGLRKEMGGLESKFFS